MNKKNNEFIIRYKNDLENLPRTTVSNSPISEIKNNINTPRFFDTIKEYNKTIVKHKKQIHELIENEMKSKQKLRSESYKTMTNLVKCQFALSIVVILIYTIINTWKSKEIISNTLAIAVIVTLTGSFLTFLGVAHKYIFSSSTELFNYAKEINLHNKKNQNQSNE